MGYFHICLSFLPWTGAMYSLTSSFHDPELHHLMLPAGKATPSFHIPNQSVLVPQTFPHWLLHQLCQKLWSVPWMNLLNCVCLLCCLSSSYQGKAPPDSQCLGAWGCFQKSLGSLLNFLFLIRWPMLNTHNSVTMLGWTLILIHKLSTHSSSSFYVFYLLLHCSFVKTNICHEDITANLD